MSEKISVVVPVYQVEKYVADCIESICNQTYTNIEIILVDDGSKDNSGHICDSYREKDSRIQVIHKKNGGLSDARNYGIDRATGKYICFIDSDDMIANNYVEKLYSLIKNEKADIAICNLQEFRNKKELELIKNNNETIKVFSSIEAIKELYNYETGVNMVIACNKLYKISLFDGIRYPEGKQHEDEFTTYKLLYKSQRTVYTDAKYYFYFKRDGSIMRQKYNLKRLDCLTAFEERMDFFKQCNEKELYSLTFQRYCYLINVQYACCKKYLPEEKKVLNDLKKKMRKNWFEFVNTSIIPLKSRVSYSITCIVPNLLPIRLKSHLESFYGK